jgi:hypothetical protein
LKDTQFFVSQPYCHPCRWRLTLYKIYSLQYIWPKSCRLMEHTYPLSPLKNIQFHSIDLCRENAFQPRTNLKGSDLRSVQCIPCPVYPVPSVSCAQCIPCPVYPVPSVSRGQCIPCPVYPVPSVSRGREYSWGYRPAIVGLARPGAGTALHSRLSP